MSGDRARQWHLCTAAVTIVALVLQVGLVINGAAALAEGDPPDLATRLGRLVSYFTIQSNLLVAIATSQLARDPRRGGQAWSALRLAGTVGITVTGLVHFLLLRPLLDLHGWNWTADKLLHVAVPVLAISGWWVCGPRPRINRPAMIGALAWPIGWLAWTLLVGRDTGWYPYPFLDVEEKGAASVAAVSAVITVLFLALLTAAYAVDRRLSAQPEVPA